MKSAQRRKLWSLAQKAMWEDVGEMEHGEVVLVVVLEMFYSCEEYSRSLECIEM